MFVPVIIIFFTRGEPLVAQKTKRYTNCLAVHSIIFLHALRRLSETHFLHLSSEAIHCLYSNVG